MADTKSDPAKTKILYCTTGVILERLIHEKNMNHYTHIVLDEVHERDIHMDFLLIVIRKMLSRNSANTKIILMSATMDTYQFSEFFKFTLPDGSIYRPPVIDLNTTPRAYEISEYFMDEFQKIWFDGDVNDLVDFDVPDISDELYDYTIKIVLLSLKMLLEDHHNNVTILIFLPGLYEIECFRNKLLFEKTWNQLIKMKAEPVICVLHSALSPVDQQNAFIAVNRPKIILATNIAESGVTIPDVHYVIDFCLSKYLAIAKGSQISTLMLDWTSKNNCKQRAGRAGRVCPGTVVRMVSKDIYDQMKNYPAPEIKRIGLEAVIVKTKLLGMGTPLDLLALALDPPEKSSVVDSVLYLKELGGLSRLNADNSFDYTDGKLTYLGYIMSSLPIDVRLTKFVILGYMFGVLDEVIIIAAGLSHKSIFTQSLNHKILSYNTKLEFSNGSGSDCIAILNAFNLWKSDQNADFKAGTKQEKQWCEGLNLDIKNLQEMELLVKEITRRLESFNIFYPEDQELDLDARDKLFMIKICIAGAFGPANYFFARNNTQQNERDAFKTINDMDLFRTVYFKNMDRAIFGDIYEKQICDAFKDNKIVESDNQMRIFFDYHMTEKVYVSFKNKLPLSGDSTKKNVGKVLPEVYKAVKMRQTRGKLELKVMSREETFKYAKEHRLGKMVEGVFKRSEHIVKNPKLCVEPTNAIFKIHGHVTYVEHCNKFFFSPKEALIANSMTYDDRYSKIIKEVNKMLKEVSRAPASASELEVGDFVIVQTTKGLKRGTFVAYSKEENCVDVYLMDCGYTMNSLDINVITVVKDKETEKEIVEIPPRIFECTLTEIAPSTILSREGKWTQQAIELFNSVIGCKATIEVYSMVDEVVSVTLRVKNVIWNRKLIDEGYAQDCEESYLSKLNHEQRRNTQNTMLEMIWPEDAFKNKIDKTLANRVVPAPPISKCTDRVLLLGPFSPLETSLNGVSRLKCSGVSSDLGSVNSVLLNDDILNFHQKFCVAAEVSYNMKNKQITVRDTTLMPNITGLSALLALIFCPTAELRRDDNKTRYLSALTGLGFDSERQEPYYGERDALIPIDFVLSVEDLESINQLRYCMSQMLMTEPENNVPVLVGFQKELAMKKIQNLVLEIVNKKRAFMEVVDLIDGFNWNVDQNDNIQRTNPQVNPAIFSFIGIPNIHKMTNAMKDELLLHIKNLNQCASGSFTIHRKTCRLCNFEWTTKPELKIHLLSNKHLKRCAQLEEDN